MTSGKKLLEAPGTTTRNTRNKGIATSNKGITTSGKKLPVERMPLPMALASGKTSPRDRQLRRLAVRSLLHNKKIVEIA